ncbi:hypothetical protein VP1G_10919 [Cytospora mali]|uniref:Uncharacterized protein n=1 Tax=Cytospora mali TaxID=578113 RepID=A0A194V0S3_CYTMA|nr:hypothetical protein VP1G_10919 [Valsa mali var. pyri (nom. inval.)]
MTADQSYAKQSLYVDRLKWKTSAQDEFSKSHNIPILQRDPAIVIHLLLALMISRQNCENLETWLLMFTIVVIVVVVVVVIVSGGGGGATGGATYLSWLKIRGLEA